VDLIYGLPGDNIEGYKASLDYAMWLDKLGKLEKIITYPLIVLPGSHFHKHMDQFGIKLLDDDSFILKSNYTFSEREMDLARKYSFFISVMYLNRSLAKAVKQFAQDRGIRSIDAVIEFMESFPFDISEGAYPDMVPSFKEHYAHRNDVFRRVLQKYDDIVDAFRKLSGNKYDGMLEDYRDQYAAKYYKMRKFAGLDP